ASLPKLPGISVSANHAQIAAVYLASPYGVLGIISHFQSFSVQSGHGYQSPFSYVMVAACLTIIVGFTHVAALVLDLNAANSGVRFRAKLVDIDGLVTSVLTLLWLGVGAVLGLKQRMEAIGGCPWRPSPGYGTDSPVDSTAGLGVLTVPCAAPSPFLQFITVSNPQICLEWFIVIGFSGAVLLSVLAMYYANKTLKVREAFVAQVWKRRQYRANKAKGIIAPPQRLARGRAPGQAQAPPTGPPPLGSTFQMVTIPPARPEAQHSSVPWSANPPTYHEVESMDSRPDYHRRDASTDSMTLPATPPPSTLPSWMQPATPFAPEHRPLLQPPSPLRT
ncbi:hypothetical protein FRC01_006177, partial [Tulasnella sp. 417]